MSQRKRIIKKNLGLTDCNENKEIVNRVMEKIGCSEKLNDSIARIPEKRSDNKKRKPNVIRFNTKNDKFEVLKKSSTKRDENE